MFLVVAFALYCDDLATMLCQQIDPLVPATTCVLDFVPPPRESPTDQSLEVSGVHLRQMTHGRAHHDAYCGRLD